MKKIFFLLIFLSLFTPVSANESIPADKAAERERVDKNKDNESDVLSKKKELTNIDLIYVGMTMDEVEKVMGNTLTVGYKNGINDHEGGFVPINLENPHRKEIITKQDKDYTVYYYYTHIKRGDGLIAEEELTPIVFEDGKVKSKGWDALFKIKNL
ncbi:MAG: DUF3192 domain-containing protein [Candidatus Omnitrophica bacterium]|nr:DUF3192 domain-containing protein [Candidatus Omnitrophota bacterium]MCB9747161.1 DUF3192 domain-containing protein [Candidatus Omnitrophota bacterium]